VSIGRRFINVARAELNSLLDFAAKRGGDGDDGRFGGAGDDDSLAGFSRQELEEELARRRSAHDEVEDAIRGRRGPSEAEAAKPRPRRSGAATDGRAGNVASASATESQKIQQAYAALEVPAGANFATVRVAYRNLMRKYHPDHHTASPAAQRAANEVAQRLTEAYKLLQKRLG
jgi:DnaJ-domain-containing protein 1